MFDVLLLWEKLIFHFFRLVVPSFAFLADRPIPVPFREVGEAFIETYYAIVHHALVGVVEEFLFDGASR